MVESLANQNESRHVLNDDRRQKTNHIGSTMWSLESILVAFACQGKTQAEIEDGTLHTQHGSVHDWS